MGDITDELVDKYLPESDDGKLTWADYRERIDALSDEVGDWQGIPIPLTGFRLRLHDRHPLYGYDNTDPNNVDASYGVTTTLVCSDDDVDENAWMIVNQWTDRSRNRVVTIMRRDGVTRAQVTPLPPDGAMDRMGYWLTTLGASDAWDLDAEHKARAKLQGMVSERAWRHYDLTGSFLETSPRSRITYMFRRSRPTIAMSPRWHWKHEGRMDWMRCLAVLCLHPIGYYDESWGGCMVPTDDVIAHLLLMRGDEAYLWRKANQHDPASPNAGL